MISVQHNFLFIHIPKTGGNSIQNVMHVFSEDNVVSLDRMQDGVERFEVRSPIYDTVKHSSYKDYRSKVEPFVFDRLFKFSTIRNPWARAISYYFSPHRGKVTWNRNEFLQFIDKIYPATYYLDSFENMDYMIRFENIEKDFDTLTKKLKLPALKLPHRNRSSASHYSKYYDDELIAKIESRFWQDILYGNYHFEQC